MILRNKSGAGQIMLPEYRQYYKAIVIRIVWYRHTQKKKAYRSVAQARKPRKKPTHLWPVN